MSSFRTERQQAVQRVRDALKKQLCSLPDRVKAQL